MGVGRRAGALAALVLAVAACGGTASSPSASSPSASGPPATGPASPVATVAPASVAPTGSSGPPATAPPLPSSVFAPGTALEVVAVELNLRAEPSTSAPRVSLLKRRDVVVVAPLDNLGNGWGPVTADGFTWYPAMQVSTPDGRLPSLPNHPIANLDGEPVSGWVAEGEGSRAYVRAMTPRCPGSVTLAVVAGMLPAERMSCFGANQFVLEGTYGCPACGVMFPGEFEPDWLALPQEIDFLSVDPSVTIGPLALRFPPDGPERPAQGSIIRVTVHVHDARAAGCRITVGAGGDAVEVRPDTAELFCRERIVVDSYEVLGSDPRFPAF